MLDAAACADDDRDTSGPARSEVDDAGLLALARAGDKRAVEELCRRNWRPVYRSFARYTADPSEAEDLTQERFLRALRALPRFADEGVPDTAYLLRIATNLARDRWRAGLSRAVPVGDIPEQRAPGPGPADLVVQSDRRAALISSLDQLGADQRAVLRLRILGWPVHQRGGGLDPSQRGGRPPAAGTRARRAPHRPG